MQNSKNNSDDTKKERLEPLEDGKHLAEKFGHIGEKKSEKLKMNEASVETSVEGGVETRETSSEGGEVVSAEKDSAYRKLLSKVKQKVVIRDDDEEEIASDAEMASLQKDAEARVQILVNLAKEKGLVHSVKVARHLDSNYVLDCLHDKLLEEKFAEEGFI